MHGCVCLCLGVLAYTCACEKPTSGVSLDHPPPCSFGTGLSLNPELGISDGLADNKHLSHPPQQRGVMGAPHQILLLYGCQGSKIGPCCTSLSMESLPSRPLRNISWRTVDMNQWSSPHFHSLDNSRIPCFLLAFIIFGLFLVKWSDSIRWCHSLCFCLLKFRKLYTDKEDPSFHIGEKWVFSLPHHRAVFQSEQVWQGMTGKLKLACCQFEFHLINAAFF